MLKLITKILGLSLLAIVVVLVLKWESAKRLYDVTTLFDEDKIVTNFSNMKDILKAQNLFIFYWVLPLWPWQYLFI